MFVQIGDNLAGFQSLLKDNDELRDSEKRKRIGPRLLNIYHSLSRTADYTKAIRNALLDHSYEGHQRLIDLLEMQKFEFRWFQYVLRGSDLMLDIQSGDRCWAELRKVIGFKPSMLDIITEYTLGRTADGRFLLPNTLNIAVLEPYNEGYEQFRSLLQHKIEVIGNAYDLVDDSGIAQFNYHCQRLAREFEEFKIIQRFEGLKNEMAKLIWFFFKVEELFGSFSQSAG